MSVQPELDGESGSPSLYCSANFYKSYSEVCKGQRKAVSIGVLHGRVFHSGRHYPIYITFSNILPGVHRVAIKKCVTMQCVTVQCVTTMCYSALQPVA